MNPITVFLTLACLAMGAGLGATGHLYSGVAVVIVAIIIASALKMALAGQQPVPQKPNGPRPQSPGAPKESIVVPQAAGA
jgi:hypothetical protein